MREVERRDVGGVEIVEDDHDRVALRSCPERLGGAIEQREARLPRIVSGRRGERVRLAGQQQDRTPNRRPVLRSLVPGRLVAGRPLLIL